MYIYKIVLIYLIKIDEFNQTFKNLNSNNLWVTNLVYMCYPRFGTTFYFCLKTMKDQNKSFKNIIEVFNFFYLKRDHPSLKKEMKKLQERWETEREEREKKWR